MSDSHIITSTLVQTTAVERVRRQLRYALRSADDGLLDLETMEDISAALRTALHELDAAIYKTDLRENWDTRAALARLN
jgi:hypothetical protein